MPGITLPNIVTLVSCFSSLFVMHKSEQHDMELTTIFFKIHNINPWAHLTLGDVFPPRWNDDALSVNYRNHLSIWCGGGNQQDVSSVCTFVLILHGEFLSTNTALLLHCYLIMWLFIFFSHSVNKTEVIHAHLLALYDTGKVPAAISWNHLGLFPLPNYQQL